ncbi:uncharacterized protein FA14DRAFT_160683 [Meira miltonrushii]|uniref:Nucleoporin Nup54 alpha-helical domain-containing protein n=1 Tax=Meira miltonrushii TaxID=1280837 RepID=A0A316VE87_9BASI|nr:uncharacterized protein FA14DRAFT_160683 [Meira miltonrushii]PWN35614.1 hypothetical protein FA14DRAFT_160683 [Meira miltonrushii]
MQGRSSSFSLGGQTARPFASTSTTNNAATPTPSFSFGGSNQPAQQPQQQQQQPAATGSSLFSFGQPQQQQNQQQPQQQTGGLFGSSTNQQNTATGGLFGNKPPAQQNQTGFGSSLFGQNQAQQQSQQQAGGGLFGSSTAAGANKPFSFGSTQPAAQQQQPQQQQAFSFGATAPAQSGQQGSSLFGQSQQNPQQQFQQSTQFGQSAAQQNASIQINPNSPFAKQAYHQKERFNDLPEDQKKLFEEMEKYINGQIRIKDELQTREYGTEIKKRISEWNELSNNISNTLLILQQDGELIKGIVDHVDKDRTDLATLYEIARNYKEGRSDGKQWINWPGDFFNKAAVEFRTRIKRYRSTIEEIEKQLATIDTRNEHSPQLISDAILHQHAIFMSMASNVANLHAEVDQLKRDYVQWYQQQYRSVRDPFAMSELTSTI